MKASCPHLTRVRRFAKTLKSIGCSRESLCITSSQEWRRSTSKRLHRQLSTDQALDVPAIQLSDHPKSHLSGASIPSKGDPAIHPVEALNRLHAKIVAGFPRIPAKYQNNRQKVDLLRNAVIGQEWATNSTTILGKEANPNIAGFYSELLSATHLFKEVERAKRIGATPATDSQPSLLPSVLFEGQRRFGRPNKGFRSGKFNGHARNAAYSGNRGNGNRFNTNQLQRRCWNCGDEDHIARHCPKPVTR